MNHQAAAGIREAIASEEFGKAQRLWADYAEELRRAIVRGRASADDLGEAAQLVKSARLSITGFQAQAAAQLAESRAASQYAGGDQANAPHVRAIL